jgi:hypothetical protein
MRSSWRQLTDNQARKRCVPEQALIDVQHHPVIANAMDPGQPQVFGASAHIGRVSKAAQSARYPNVN